MRAQSGIEFGGLLRILLERRRYLFVLLVVCVGVALSAAAFLAVRTWESQRLRADFEQDAEARIFEFEKMLAANLEALRSIRSFYAASNFVDREEFRTFVEPALSHHPSIQALEWIPRVPASQRTAHEEAAHQEGFPGYQIIERQSQGTMIRAALRDEYFPVYYVEPYEGNEAVLGFDLVSNPTRLAALIQSRDTGQPVATARITLVQETGNQFGFLVFSPVYRNGFPAETLADRRKNLQGFILGVYSVNGIAHHSLMMVNPSKAREGMDLHVYDRSAPPEEQLLFTKTHIAGGEHIRSLLRHVDTLDVGGREWEVTVASSATARWLLWQSWAVLGVGFVVTSLLSAYLLAAIRRTSVVERLVADRTLELSRANLRLEEEAVVRVRTAEELREAREAALQASRTKSEFLASMSHEIRTPMNAIVGMAELLLDSQLTLEQQEYVEVFQSSGSTLLDIINDILDLSKVESGQLSLEMVDFDLAEIVENTVQILAIRAHEKGIELHCQIKTDVPTSLVGDPVRLRQALTNLVGNAIKFTDKGEVTLRVENDPGAGVPGALLFSISDTGIGIPPEKLEAVFDRFTQGDSSTTREYGGTGLGLAICQRLVDLMDGRIWVESEVGKGSVFYFNARFEIPSQTGNHTALSWEALKGLKVLIVDDNATNRLILRETLAAWGASATVAEDGYRAMSELNRALHKGESYRVMLLDRRMPGMDGFEVAARVQQDLGSTDMAIMMLTSDDRTEDIKRCRELGISRYLIKPVRRLDLLRAITAVLDPEADAQEAPARVVEPAIFEDQRPLRILLVEDYKNNRLMIQSYLKKTPYQLDIAENGEIAVGKFTSGRYDLVLMDIQMPVMDGYTATSAIRSWESEQGVEPTPIIALTAYALKEEEQRSLDAGCNAHVNKPIKKAPLMEAIYQHTGSVTS